MRDKIRYQAGPTLKDGQVSEVRSVNYQDYSGDDCGLPNHWLVIVSVVGNPCAKQYYFPDTAEGERDARRVSVGDISTGVSK